MTEGRDTGATADTRAIQTRNTNKVRHDLRAGHQKEAASIGEGPAAYIPTSLAPAETPFHTLDYIYINGSVGSRLVADRVRSEVHRKLA